MVSHYYNQLVLNYFCQTVPYLYFPYTILIYITYISMLLLHVYVIRIFAAMLSLFIPFMALPTLRIHEVSFAALRSNISVII